MSLQRRKEAVKLLLFQKKRKKKELGWWCCCCGLIYIDGTQRVLEMNACHAERDSSFAAPGQWRAIRVTHDRAIKFSTPRKRS
jgi:hypothetical protein